MSNVYENDHYTVEVVEAVLSEPEGVKVYSLINKETSVREGDFPFLPQAMQYADQLSESMVAWEEDGEEVKMPGEEALAEYSH